MGPQGWLPPRTLKKLMKNDMMAHGDYLAPPPCSHTECTLCFGQWILNIISTDHRIWSSMCPYNCSLKNFPEQNSLRYWKFFTSRRYHTFHCKPQTRPQHPSTLCFVFTKSLVPLGPNPDKDKSSFLVEFPEYLWSFSCFFFCIFSPL